MVIDFDAIIPNPDSSSQDNKKNIELAYGHIKIIADSIKSFCPFQFVIRPGSKTKKFLSENPISFLNFSVSASLILDDQSSSHQSLF